MHIVIAKLLFGLDIVFTGSHLAGVFIHKNSCFESINFKWFVGTIQTDIPYITYPKANF